MAADLTAFGEGRTLDDDGNILLRFENGAKGSLIFSQIATGEENNLSIRVYGTKGSVFWQQEKPNELLAKWLDKPHQVYTPGGHHIKEKVANICTYSRRTSGRLSGKFCDDIS